MCHYRWHTLRGAVRLRACSSGPWVASPGHCDAASATGSPATNRAPNVGLSALQGQPQPGLNMMCRFVRVVRVSAPSRAREWARDASRDVPEAAARNIGIARRRLRSSDMRARVHSVGPRRSMQHTWHIYRARHGAFFGPPGPPQRSPHRLRKSRRAAGCAARSSHRSWGSMWRHIPSTLHA